MSSSSKPPPVPNTTTSSSSPTGREHYRVHHHQQQHHHQQRQHDVNNNKKTNNVNIAERRHPRQSSFSSNSSGSSSSSSLKPIAVAAYLDDNDIATVGGAEMANQADDVLPEGNVDEEDDDEEEQEEEEENDLTVVDDNEKDVDEAEVKVLDNELGEGVTTTAATTTEVTSTLDSIEVVTSGDQQQLNNLSDGSSGEDEGINTTPKEDIEIDLDERFRITQSIWYLPSINRASVVHFLQGKPVGVFIVSIQLWRIPRAQYLQFIFLGASIVQAEHDGTLGALAPGKGTTCGALSGGEGDQSHHQSIGLSPGGIGALLHHHLEAGGALCQVWR